MTDLTPEAAAQRAFVASYSGKLCPYLTIAGAKGSALVGVPASSEAVACQGPSCMLFVPIADENGRVCSGGCALALLPTALGQIKDSALQIARVLSMASNPNPGRT